MGLDGSFRHHQRIGHLAVRFPLGNEPHDLAFTLREPCTGYVRRVTRDEIADAIG